MKNVHRAGIETNVIMQKLMLDEVLRLQLDKDSGEREFRLRPDMVELMNRLMLDNQMLLNEVKYEELIAR